jgi:hypothetical protein
MPLTRLPRVTLIATVAATAVIVVYLWGAKDLIGEVVLFAMGDDTEYAAGFTEEKFDAIRVGDAEDRVLAILGDPIKLVESRSNERTHVLLYATSPRSTHYRRRVVVIADSVVKEVISDIWVD